MSFSKKHVVHDRKATGKIWIVFLIFVFILICVAYSSYQSFSSLTRSIEELSKPNEKERLINETFQEIFQAENRIQAYILTGDQELQDQYKNQVASCQSKMQELHVLFENDTIKQHMVDSLQTLFETKLVYLNAYLKLKNKKEKSVFTNLALTEIQVQLNDSILTELELRKNAYFDLDSEPLETQELVLIPDDYKGVGGFIRKILGGDNSAIDTVSVTKENFFLTQKTQVDTSILKDYSPDSTLMQVKNILSGIMKKEKFMQQQISEKELSLLSQDQVFILNIRAIIDQLRKEEQAGSIQSIIQARQIANQSIRLIVITGVMGLLMSGVFLFLILRDTTRSFFYRKQLEKEKLRVEELASIKEQFLANMSHEIRTPLQSIQGFSELFRFTELDDNQKKYMEGINQSNAYLTELIGNILDQSKIEAGKLEIVESKFSMLDLTQNLEVVFSQMATNKGVYFGIVLPETLESMVLVGDSLRIKQVLTNLLSNAIKFTIEGEVLLTIKDEKSDESFVQLQMEVSDTGIGIDTKNHDTVFEQFTQEKTESNVHNYAGTGLGLSIAKELTEAMGGRIMIDSELGKGTVFTVLLKLPYLASQKNLSAEIPEQESVKHMSGNVMIVEDDLWNSTLLKEVVSIRVNSVEVFENGVEALTFLEKEDSKIDIIFTDINMPLMDGTTFLKEVRKFNSTIPIIALTAHMQEDKLIELKKEGFDRVCSKPYKIVDIEAVLESFLETIKPSSKPNETGSSLLETPIYSGFDFAIIWQFSDHNEDRFIDLLNSLIVNNKRQVINFDTYLDNEDDIKLAEISHQMKTTYDNLGLTKVSESLESIELFGKLSKKSRLIESAKELYPDLMEINAKLEAARSHFDTISS